MGPFSRYRSAALRAALVMATLAGSVSPRGATPLTAAEPVRFGVDSKSVELAKANGLDVRLGTFWVGAWTQKYGWGGAEKELKAAAARDITLVLHWWYWGDDISPSCVEDGCRDARQGVWKDKATWYRMTGELADLIEKTAGNRETIVIVETEFNKNGIETYEPFDGYLRDQLDILARRGHIKTVVGFGNWGKSNWSRFDRAVEGADYLGIQLLRSSVRDASTYLRAVDTLIAGAEYLQTTFGKPSLVTDLGLSSYPSYSYESYQETVVEELFRRIEELKGAGVRGVLYRMLVDDPNFDTSNYHGTAERYWGLLRSDGTRKPAFARMVAGVDKEFHRPTPTWTRGAKAPRNVKAKAQAQGRMVTIEWDRPADASGVAGYLLEAGSAPGASDLGTIHTSGEVFTAADVPAGTYYLRIRPLVGGVAGPASEEVITTIDALPRSCPSAPLLSADVSNSLVTLTWSKSDSAVTGYRLQVGSAPGLADVMQMPLPAASSSFAARAPRGTYYARLVVVSACGADVLSNEVTVVARGK